MNEHGQEPKNRTGMTPEETELWIELMEKGLAAQRQHYHAQEVEFLRRAALAATGRKSCAKVLNVFDAGAMDRKMAAVRDAAVGEAFRRRV